MYEGMCTTCIMSATVWVPTQYSRLYELEQSDCTTNSHSDMIQPCRTPFKV